MISISEIKASAKEAKTVVVELRGLSTDEKPTELTGSDIANGCTFIEIDTGKIYFYDLENELWKEV